MDDPLEGGCDESLRPRRQGRGSLFQDSAEDVGRRVAAERPATLKHLVQDASEREDVRTMVGSLASGLFGSHVPRRAENHVGQGVRNEGEPRVGCAHTGPRQFCEPEVENLDPILGCDEDVVRLEVAMDDALLVCSGERLRDLKRILGAPPDGQAFLAKAVGERRAFEQFGDEVGNPLERPDIVDRQHAGVVERGSSTRFLLEPVQPLRIDREDRRHHFDRDRAPELGVPGPVHAAHSTLADQAFKFVPIDPRGDGVVHREHRCSKSGSTS
jgi:hypothetical protein